MEYNTYHTGFLLEDVENAELVIGVSFHDEPKYIIEVRKPKNIQEIGDYPTYIIYDNMPRIDYEDKSLLKKGNYATCLLVKLYF